MKGDTIIKSNGGILGVPGSSRGNDLWLKEGSFSSIGDKDSSTKGPVCKESRCVLAFLYMILSTVRALRMIKNALMSTDKYLHVFAQYFL